MDKYSKNKFALSALTCLGLALLVILFSLFYETQQPVPNDLNAPTYPLKTSVNLPEPQYKPAPQVDITELPHIPLSQSDSYITSLIFNISNGMNLSPYLNRDNFIRRLVNFIDHIAQGQLHHSTSPTLRPQEKFKPHTIDGKLYLDPENFHRYDFYAHALANINLKNLSQIYTMVQPLLNEAFIELGYQENQFHSTLLKAIDEIMKAPVIHQPIVVKHEQENYKFVQPELESLSPIQKLMIRMGPENTTRIQESLKEMSTYLEP
tara:strand:- start:7747 stop:8538 length:792 start_codon:yes stop_codon:yes gene_type:complete